MHPPLPIVDGLDGERAGFQALLCWGLVLPPPFRALGLSRQESYLHRKRHASLRV